MTEKYIENYESYLDKWGETAQLIMALEEMSELSKEICKYLRYSTFEKENDSKISKTVENLRCEIADVLNTTEQLELCFGIDKVEKIREDKIARTDALVKGEN